MKELPASVGRLHALQSLILYDCKGLTSLPDLSGLEKLEVEGLPEAMKPWKEQGYKAFALPITYSEDAWLLGDEEWVKCAGGAGNVAAR